MTGARRDRRALASRGHTAAIALASRGHAAAIALALLCAVNLTGCGQTNGRGAPERAKYAGGARAGSETSAHDEAARVPYFDEWKPTTFGNYLAPRSGFSDDNVGLIFHFHAGLAADKDWRTYAPPNTVIVAGTWGVTTAQYSNAFKDPKRFDRVIEEVMGSFARQPATPP